MMRVTVDEARLAQERERDPRRRALVRFLWEAGTRLSEALAIRAEDIDVELALVRVVTLKRRVPETRTCPLPREFCSELLALASASSKGRPFHWSKRVAYGYVRYALEMAGVDADRAHPHALRHGHAVHALTFGAPLHTVSRALGHASVATTSTYLRATGEDVRREYRRISW